MDTRETVIVCQGIYKLPMNPPSERKASFFSHYFIFFLNPELFQLNLTDDWQIHLAQILIGIIGLKNKFVLVLLYLLFLETQVKWLVTQLIKLTISNI